jgi:hypothetical protein
VTRTVIVRAQQRWDYCFESRRTETSLLLTLNDLGQQGWEVVDVLYYKDIKGIMAWGAFLKRPSIAAAGKAGEDSTIAARPAPSGKPEQAAEKAPSPQGFDLNGDEFPVKTE